MNTALTPIQRLYYLRSSLKGKTTQVIRSLEVSAATGLGI